VSHSNCCWSTKLRTTRAQMMKDATGTPNCSLPDQPECNEVLIYRQQQCGFQHERRDYRKNPPRCFLGGFVSAASHPEFGSPVVFGG
jgi:hypothetical protein